MASGIELLERRPEHTQLFTPQPESVGGEMQAAPFIAISLLLLLGLGLIIGLLAVKHRGSKGVNQPDSAEREK